MVWGKYLQEKVHSSVVIKTMTRLIQTSTLAGMQCTSILHESKETAGSAGGSNKITPVKPPGSDSRLPGGPRGVPTALDKIFLVGSGRFKSRKDVPKELEPDVIHRARSWGRIRVNMGFLLIAATGGILMVYLGKQAASRGESLEKQNLEWHRQIKEEYEKGKGK